MSCRQTNYANRRKAELIAVMGNCCWACGATSSLEVDHPNGRDWKPREKSFCCRVARYWREWEQRTIRLLCSDCNKSCLYNGVVLPFPGDVLESHPADPNIPF